MHEIGPEGLHKKQLSKLRPDIGPSGTHRGRHLPDDLFKQPTEACRFGVRGHFQLTCRLWPALRRAAAARVIALSSYGHRRAGVDFHDPNFEVRTYDPWVAYGQSKTANALFAVALDSIGQQQGVRAFSVHPGGIVTRLVRHMSQTQIDASEILDRSGKPIIDPRNNKKTPQQGAATTVWCATSPRLEGMGGVYCADCEIARALPSDDATELHGVRPRATDPVAAGRLWQLSEQLTGVRLD